MNLVKHVTRMCKIIEFVIRGVHTYKSQVRNYFYEKIPHFKFGVYNYIN